MLIGEGLLSAFHISLAALKIAGGLILLLFALHLVLGEERKDEAETGPPAPSLDIAVYPLAMPLMATPQGLVAIVTLAASMRGGGLLLLLALVLVVMVFNLFFMLFADRILGLLGPAALKVVLRVFGLLLCGLAVQLIFWGSGISASSNCRPVATREGAPMANRDPVQRLSLGLAVLAVAILAYTVAANRLTLATGQTTVERLPRAHGARCGGPSGRGACLG